MKIDSWFTRQVYPEYPRANITLELDKSKVALLVVDMQNNFINPEVLAAKGVPTSAPGQIIGNNAVLVDACRKAGIRVIYARHTFRADYSDRSQMYFEMTFARQTVAASEEAARMLKEGRGGSSLLRDSWHSAIVDALKPLPEDIVIDSKHLYSCFYQTDLELVLRSLGIETLLVTGVSTSVCVETTVRDALHRNFRCLLVEDCTWDKSLEMGTASKKVLSLHFAYLTSSQDVLRALAAVA